MADLFVVLEIYNGDDDPGCQSIEPFTTLEEAREMRTDLEDTGGSDCEVSYHVYRLVEVPDAA